MIEKIAKEIFDESCVEAAYLVEENYSIISIILFSDSWIELKSLGNFTK